MHWVHVHPLGIIEFKYSFVTTAIIIIKVMKKISNEMRQKDVGMSV